MSAGKDVTGTRVPKTDIQVSRRSCTVLDPQTKHAVWRVTGGLNSGTIKELICEALETRGWDRARIEREYLRYSLSCARDGEVNLFPGGRV